MIPVIACDIIALLMDVLPFCLDGHQPFLLLIIIALDLKNLKQLIFQKQNIPESV